ncbi:MAG: response regulator transcription factor [Candidatus Saccharimonadales bacterium]
MIDILLIEDNRNVAEALRQATTLDYSLTIAHTGLSGLKLASKNQYDAIILDLHLPDTHGLDICQELRTKGITTPILILSGEDKIMSKIKLLDAGANDYLTKPFSLGELKVRLRVLLRDSQPTSAAPGVLEVGDLRLDPATHSLERSGRVIQLRRKEFSLLECLMLHANNVVTRTTLGNYAWQHSEAPWTNTIDVHIKHLRDKVDRPFESSVIQTIHGVGYKIIAPQPLAVGKE